MKHLFIFFIFILFSCNNHKIEIKIKNNSSKKIEKIELTNGYDFHNFFMLSKQDTIIYLDFKDVKYDGLCGIKYIQNNSLKSTKFCYYSNGVPDFYNYFLIIENDTVIINNK
ncbi:hypothetical protein [Flavobacterium sp.]|uniref:hypothetical protein n=1 Tax=Flavobacterium sp. TaxID=239 RepID=UPI0040478E46